MKTVYCLRTRFDDAQEWGSPEFYASRRTRNKAEAMVRIIGGIRTHSYEEKKNTEEYAKLLVNGQILQ